jgi:hypothetical protein
MQRVWLSVTVLAVLVMVATACGKKASETASEKMIESTMRAKGQDAEVTVNSGTMQVKTKEGDLSFGEGTKLPDQWPDDVPVYKGLKLLSATKTKESFSIQGTTADSQGKVAAFYKEQVAKGGWTEETVTTQAQMAMMMYSKDKRSLAVIISAQDSETSVSITISSE